MGVEVGDGFFEHGLEARFFVVGGDDDAHEHLCVFDVAGVLIREVAGLLALCPVPEPFVVPAGKGLRRRDRAVGGGCDIFLLRGMGRSWYGCDEK